MVLNYCATNYIGWPLPAFCNIINYSAKIQKINDTCKLLYNYFALIYINFPFGAF